MLPKLAHASKLRVEVEGWRAKSRTLQNTMVTEKVLKLTDEIIKLTKLIDDWHDAKKNGFITPHLAGDTRAKINGLRLQVIDLLKSST